MGQGLDYSAGRPSAAAIKAAGYDFVVRYAGTPGRAKNITRAEFADLAGGGVGVALVYENRAGDALGGYNAGVAGARAARADATSVGFPVSRPIYMACDTDIVTEAQFRAVMDYLRGAGSVLGGPTGTGVYGEFDVVMRARREGVTHYEWQTGAWSRGQRDAEAELYQRIGYVYIGQMAADRNDQQRPDFGQHNYAPEDDMTPDQDRMLTAIFQGLYVGGPSTSDQVLANVITGMGFQTAQLYAATFLGGPSTPEGRSLLALAAEAAGKVPADVNESEIIAGLLPGVTAAVQLASVESRAEIVRGVLDGLPNDIARQIVTEFAEALRPHTEETV